MGKIYDTITVWLAPGIRKHVHHQNHSTSDRSSNKPLKWIA